LVATRHDRQIIAAFFKKPLKFPVERPNHGDETPKLVGCMRSLPHVSTVSGGQTKDLAMSNDIQPSAARAPAAAAAAMPAARAAEVKPTPPAPAEVKPAVENRPDPHEARRNLQETSEKLNQQMAKNGRDLSFSVDDVANKVVLTVKNREGEVVRQIPNEVVLRVAHNLEDMKGLMQDDKS
jgi:flagellar protein FlaG